MTFGDRFLRRPSGFPTGIGGEAWGENSITLDIAGPIRFSGLREDQLAAVRERYGRGLGDDDPAGVPGLSHVRCMRLPREELVLFDRTGWEYTLDLDATPERVRIAGYNFLGVVLLGPTLGGALWICEDGNDEFISAFENFYRVFTAYQALDRGGVLLHSAGILRDGQAILFFGHSGAGKSTLAGNALRDGLGILSDDLNLILPGKTPTVRRVPFAGTYGQGPAGDEGFPLAAILSLRQGDNERRRLSRAAALVGIIGSAPFVNRDPYRHDRLAEIAEGLVSRFEPWEIAAAREGPGWDDLDAPPP